MLAVYSEAYAEIYEWEVTLPHGPRDQVILWEGVGHFLHQERPAEFAELARNWLATL